MDWMARGSVSVSTLPLHRVLPWISSLSDYHCQALKRSLRPCIPSDGLMWPADLIHVGQGSHLKKTWPHGRGRSGVRRMYRSHLTVSTALQ